MENKKFDEKAFGDILASMANAFSAGNSEKYPDVVEQFTYRHGLEPESQESPLANFKGAIEAKKGIMINVDSLTSGLIKSYTFIDRDGLTESNKELYNILVYDDVEKFLDNYFMHNEGHGMSHDKTSFVVNRLIKAVLENKDDVDFISTYADAGRPDMDEPGKVPYWVPGSITNVAEFLELYKLYEKLKNGLLRKDVLAIALERDRLINE